MNNIKMPKVSYGKCQECQVAAEYFFSEFGSNESCINCNASPISIIKVQLVEVSA
jgi:hypothetical protein